MNLFEIGKEKKLQKTVRVLVYPNITFQKDLEKDSYIQVIKKQIKLLKVQPGSLGLAVAFYIWAFLLSLQQEPLA